MRAPEHATWRVRAPPPTPRLCCCHSVGNRAFSADYIEAVPDTWALVNRKVGGFDRPADVEGVHARALTACSRPPLDAPPPSPRAPQDPIPRIPSGLGYKRCGERVTINPQGDMIVRPSYFEMSLISRWAIGTL